MNILHNKALKRIPICGILSKFALKIQKEPIMKRIFIPFTILLSTVLVFASCLNDDDKEVTYYDDSGITSFTLGTLNRTMHTLSSKGVDSTYQTTIAGSSYQFYIDQDKREIYNPDSLPFGTDVKHVICTVLAKNNGLIGIKSLVSDSVFSYSSTDSIDFSTPRQMVAYANSGRAYRYYTVHVNVHQEEADVFNWSDMGKQETFSFMNGMKVVACNSKLFTFGQKDGQLVGYATDDTDGRSWSQLSLPESLSQSINAYQNILAKDGLLYILQDQLLLRSVDGTNWETVSTTNLSRLVAAGTKKLYGISTEGALMASADQGATWTEEKMDASSEWLPEGNISYACVPLRTNEDIERLIFAGNRSVDAYPNDCYAVVWSKVEDLSGDAEDNGWMFYTQTEDLAYCLPRLSDVAMCAYGDVLLAFGGKGIGACTENAFSKICVSLDGGITWKGTSTYPVPEGLTGMSQPFTSTVDTNNCLWIILGDGQVWRGRLNRLGWANIQKNYK